jgi:hypothetical protein
MERGGMGLERVYTSAYPGTVEADLNCAAAHKMSPCDDARLSHPAKKDLSWGAKDEKTVLPAATTQL